MSCFSAEVINLYFTHQETEPLGVTPNHLLWSVTHGGWMHAGDLKVGDTVKTKNGTAKLTKKEKKPGRHQVYNLEVHQSHTYYVSNIGVLAHNDKLLPAKVGDALSFIKPTQPLLAGTAIPKSFEISIGNEKLWVHPNATEHMQEFINRGAKAVKNSPRNDLNSQLLLKDFHAALPHAYQKLKKLGKIDGETNVKVGDWTIAISQRPTDKYPAVMHAEYRKE